MIRSLVLGASGGIGAAVARALAGRGEVVALSRRGNGLDVSDEAGAAAALGALDGPFDMIFVATGALGAPEKSLKSYSSGEAQRQFAVNAIGPLLVLKHALRMMPRDRRAVFAVLSARVGSISDNGLGGWYSYRASKAALNQYLKTASVEIARTHRHAVIAALHPGTVDTGFTAGYGHDKVSPASAAANLLTVLDGLGPGQSGGFFDYAGKVIPW